MGFYLVKPPLSLSLSYHTASLLHLLGNILNAIAVNLSNNSILGHHLGDHQLLDHGLPKLARSADDVGVDEKVDKKDCKEAIERKANRHDGNGGVTGKAEKLQLQGLVVDKETDKHLSNLEGRNGQADGPGNVNVGHLNGVVGVHERVDKEVHVDHPSGGGRGVREDEPAVVERK